MEKSIENQQSCTRNESTKSTWIQLAIAVSFEIVGAIILRLSKGFTLTFPTLIALSSFAIALYLVSRVMKSLPVSIAYPIWAGGGTVGVALLGILALKEKANIWKSIGISMVVTGIVVLNVSG